METYTEIERRRLLAILGENRELVSLACGKIYTCGVKGDEWLDSDLEGFLCFVIDFHDNSRYFVLYDTGTYDKLFQVELYLDFSKYYTALSNNFHCFEMNNGFIGIKFENSLEANKMLEAVKKNTEDKKILLTRKDKYKKSKDIVEILKKKFCNSSCSSNLEWKEEYDSEHGIDICKPKHFSLLNHISFDRNKQKFMIGEIPSDLKKLFKMIGLKKSDLKDTYYALNIFKILIQAFETLQYQKREKTKKLVKIEGKVFQKEFENNTNSSVKKTSFMDYRKKVSSEISLDEDFIDRKSNSVCENKSTTINNNPPKCIPSVPNVTQVPLIPSVPEIKILPNLPEANKNQLNTPSENTNKTDSNISSDTTSAKPQINSGGTIQDQIGKVLLKPVDQRPFKINQNDTNKIILMDPLQMAIKKRREMLTKNDVSSDESDNDWSDDD